MGSILNHNNLNKLPKQKKTGKTLVLVGGCFDILHAGHIEFLKKAKKTGDILIVLLESDEKIKKIKGKKRPINSQDHRAALLSNLPFVDYIISLPDMKNDNDYRILVKKIEPDIIAVTAGNRIYDWEKEYIERMGGKIVEVMDRSESYSTTKIAQKI